MATRKTPPVMSEKNRQTYLNVLANFKRRDTSFNAFCEQNNIHRGNATKALLGIWRSKKAKALRSQIIQSSKAKKPTNPTQEAGQ